MEFLTSSHSPSPRRGKLTKARSSLLVDETTQSKGYFCWLSATDPYASNIMILPWTNWEGSLTRLQGFQQQFHLTLFSSLPHFSHLWWYFSMQNCHVYQQHTANGIYRYFQPRRCKLFLSAALFILNQQIHCPTPRSPPFRAVQMYSMSTFLYINHPASSAPSLCSSSARCSSGLSYFLMPSTYSHPQMVSCYFLYLKAGLLIPTAR